MVLGSKTGYRASDKGFLNMSLEEYFQLLVFTGKQAARTSGVKIKAEGELPLLALLLRH